jgi:predicted PurR-regulated permease PerM
LANAAIASSRVWRDSSCTTFPVEVRQPPPTALESIAALISPLLRPLTTTGIMVIFVVFILLQREDLRNRRQPIGERGGNNVGECRP